MTNKEGVTKKTNSLTVTASFEFPYYITLHWSLLMCRENVPLMVYNKLQNWGFLSGVALVGDYFYIEILCRLIFFSGTANILKLSLLKRDGQVK